MEEYHRYWKNKYRREKKLYNSAQMKNIDIFREWCEKYNICEFDSSKDWYNFIPRVRCDLNHEHMPLYDHVVMFRGKNKELIFISQPYANEDSICESNIFQWAKERGLKVEVSKELSWHCPGGTILLQYTLENEELFRDFIKKHSYMGRY
jgi:hypothetical protein